MRMAGTLATIGVILTLGVSGVAADQPMGFFVTSVGMGDGGNLGGL